MKKLNFITFIVLLVILFLYRNVLAITDTASTATDVDNSSPSITQSVSDGGSTLSAPTYIGGAVTFSATAYDVNLDQYYLAVCKTNAVTAGNNAAPSCPGGAWAISSATNNGSQATAAHTVAIGDAGNNEWYAFVCDKVAGSAGCNPANGSGDQGFAVGSISFSGIPADGASVTVDGVRYEFDTANNGISSGVEVDTSASQSGSQVASALVSAENGSGSHMIFRSNKVYVYSDVKGVSGNSIGLSEADDTGDMVTLSGSALIGGNDANASPFYVSNINTFGNLTVTNTSDGPIKPGDALKFTLPQAEVTGGTYNMYICTGSTTAFNYTANTCTGGSLICADPNVNPATEDGMCNSGEVNVPIPTPHGSYNYKVYVENVLDYPATGTNAKSYTVIDVPPLLDSYNITDTLNPIAGGTDTMQFNALITDNNGENDITLADGSFYDSNATQEWNQGLCASDELKCYNASSCTLNTSAGNSAQAEAQCSVDLWFNANASSVWKAHINFSDELGKVINSDSSNMNITNPEISGIDVAQNGITYGSIVIGGTSSPVETSIGNVGNQAIDIYLSGSNMTSGSNNIPAAQQKWDHVTGDFDWDSAPQGSGPYSLVSTPSGLNDAGGCLNRDIPVRTTHSSTSGNESIFWKLRIPSNQATGTYTGTNTFATTDADTCTEGAAY